MKNLPIQLAIFCSGFLACLFFTQKNCVQVPKEYQMLHDTVFVQDLDFGYDLSVRDTVYKTLVKTKWYPKTDTLVQHVLHLMTDTIREAYPNEVDFDYANYVPINEYEDSVITDDYKLNWKSSVYGTILTMDMDVKTFEKATPVTKPKAKNWQAGLGLGVGQAGGLYPKASVGYKGWMIEPVFDSNFKYDRIYVTKLVRF